ncbi:hypothetical protein S7335_456 [Synechococcus sp. PCC 7335]|uniref:hypothetical protein n=1 Tax=Synechococcus sp. (strain ATCC 29403 / PCC 7335) TaxID=91464 RepID=UPI00017EC80A|nr:hypothetical protein [Synechococcus sp. PCC 7335]EDX83276.1 hypothetical protein S7335_456 [Synechococcus sp. PCC 7335]
MSNREINRAYSHAITLVYGTVMRNLSIALAIAMTAFGNEQGFEIGRCIIEI